jgi:DNA-binding CsgD family transcriptional regulator
VATIEQLGLPAAVLTGRGRLCAANDLFANLTPAVVALHTGEVMLRDVRSARLFRSGLDELREGSGSAVHSIPVRAGNGHGPLVLHLLPLHGVARNFFGEAEVLMVATAPVSAPAPSADLLNGLFDLSPAETRLVRHLARGTTVSEVASATGVSVATLRTQLSSIFAKTGTTRQAELLTLVSAIWTPLVNLVGTNC